MNNRFTMKKYVPLVCSTNIPKDSLNQINEKAGQDENSTVTYNTRYKKYLNNVNLFNKIEKLPANSMYILK